jgi:hypothetical protein
MTTLAGPSNVETTSRPQRWRDVGDKNNEPARPARS